MSNDAPKLNLAEVRGRIDAIDTEIQRLIAERANFARQVGQAKGPLKAAVDYYRPEREAQVLRMVIARNQGPLSNEEMVRLFREIMSACLAQQEPLKIAFARPLSCGSTTSVIAEASVDGSGPVVAPAACAATSDPGAGGTESGWVDPDDAAAGIASRSGESASRSGWGPRAGWPT